MRTPLFTSGLCLLYLGQMKGNRVCEPPGLKTLFLEMLFKLLSQGFVPAKSRQEVTRWAQPSLAPRPGFREQNLGVRGQSCLQRMS